MTNQKASEWVVAVCAAASILLISSCDEDKNPVKPDTEPPVLSVTNPVDGQEVTDTVPVTVTATDNVGVANVSFEVDGDSVYTDSIKPWEWYWSVGDYEHASKHTVRVRASDAAGNSSVFTVNEIAVDKIAPAQISDLNTVDSTVSSVTLSWTAPGDDSTTGRAELYDIRYAIHPLMEINWDSAAQYSDSVRPKMPGELETRIVDGLSSNTIYYFAVRTADNVSNYSAISSSPGTSTLDAIPPSTILDLAIVDSSGTTLTLTWTAPGENGDSGIANEYDMRYWIDVQGTADWESGERILNLPNPKKASEPESLFVSGLDYDTEYWYSIRAVDSNQNWSLPSESTLGKTRPLLSLTSSVFWGRFGQPYVSKGVVAGDLDSDGDIDMAVVFNGKPMLSILRNDGMGGFHAENYLQVHNLAGESWGIEAEDLDVDGDLDLLLMERNGPYDRIVRVLDNRGGGWYLTTDETYPVGEIKNYLCTGDFDADGLPDLAVAGTSSDTIYVFKNLGGFHFDTPVTYYPIYGARDIIASDLDGDHHLDLVINASYHLASLMNVGDTGFAVEPNASQSGFIYSMAEIDIGQDGIPDFVGDALLGFVLAMGHGDGTFSFGTPFDLGGMPRDISVGDFDQDGFADDLALVLDDRVFIVLDVTETYTGMVYSFPYEGLYDRGNEHLAVADFDGDGDTDVIVFDPGHGYHIFMNNTVTE